MDFRELSMNKTICIVGGGSAGWMVAAYLAKNTPHTISLIESKNIPIIGVGESTFASMPTFLTELGITDEDIYKDCSAVRKYAIKHHNWNGDGETWTHRFCYSDDDIEQQDALMNDYAIPEEKWRYGFHLDATKLGLLIKEKSAIPNGVEHIIDDIIDVNVTNGQVDSIVGNNAVYTADMFVDCTGFKALLRGKLPAEYKSHNALINNCAVCGPGTYDNDEAPLPYTETWAMDYGWKWRVSLQHRTGNGYAFNKDMISVEEATQEFIKTTPGLNKDKIFVVDINNTYNPEPWKGNVISFGLSCGFLEPLEATGLYLVYGPLEFFTRLLDDPKGARKFNRLWNRLYTHVTEFVSHQFTTSKLNHTEYWRSIPKVDKVEPKHVHFNNSVFTYYNYKLLADVRNLPLVVK
jgi:tryptophan halogenase